MRGRWTCCSPATCMCRDHFGLKENGASIGDNVGNAIYAKSRKRHRLRWRGARYQRPQRAGKLHFVCPLLRSVAPYRHSSAGIRLNSTMIGINVPIRIGGALVMPGDVVLGRDGGGDLHSAAARRTRRRVIGNHTPARRIRPPASASRRLHRRTDRRPLDAADRGRLHRLAPAEHGQPSSSQGEHRENSVRTQVAGMPASDRSTWPPRGSPHRDSLYAEGRRKGQRANSRPIT